MSRCGDCAAKHRKCPHRRSLGDGTRVLVLPDTQLKAGVPMDHMTWAGRYAVEKRPGTIVHIGDAADMPSLSSFDVGKKSFEGRRYRIDVDAARKGMELFSNEIAKASGYSPRMVLTYGNHEARITRAVDSDPKLEGTIGLSDLGFEELGWECHGFLSVVKIHGVEFSHYFVSGPMGRPVSSARVMLRERMGSCIQGHNQRFDMAVHPTGEIAMMVGAFYQHSEEYLGPQGQAARLQLVMMNEIRGRGIFDPMLISMNYLKRKFGSLS